MISLDRMDAAHVLDTEVRGHSIAYRMQGEGPPLVLLHGFLCDSRCWRTQLDGLSDRFKVIAWDAPGAGASSDPPETFTITDWASVLVSFLDALEIGPATVLGLSWGGMLAQEVYRLYPDRVERLVLADTYAGWKGSLPPDAVEKRVARCYRDAARPAAEVVDEWVPADFFADASPELVDEMARVFVDFHPPGFRLMAKSLAETDTTDLLPRIAVPTLLVWGERDVRSPLDIARAFERAIPRASLEVIQGLGHVSNMESPTMFNEAVRRFLLP